jgi:hypothetical protein
LNPLFDYDTKTAPDAAEPLTLNGNLFMSGVTFDAYDTLNPVPISEVPTSNVSTPYGPIKAYYPLHWYLRFSTQEFVFNITTYWSYVNATHAFNISPRSTGDICYKVNNYNFSTYINNIADCKRVTSMKLKNLKGSKKIIDRIAHTMGMRPLIFTNPNEQIADVYITYGQDVAAPGYMLAGCQNQLLASEMFISRYAFAKYGMFFPATWLNAQYYPKLNNEYLSTRNIIQNALLVNTTLTQYLDDSFNLNAQFVPASCNTPLDFCADFYNTQNVTV